MRKDVPILINTKNNAIIEMEEKRVPVFNTSSLMPE